MFFKRHRPKPEGPLAPLAPPRVPPGARVYAIGDIHGRVDLLDQIITFIEADLARSPCGDVIVVPLGDYVDRGPNPGEVLDRLIEGALPGRVMALRGNHEDILLRFLDNPRSVAKLWLQCGGLETLHGYGVDVRELKRHGRTDEAAQAFRAVLPQSHRTFLEELPFAVSVGDYFFCHAGVRPGVSLDNQDERDLLWIREDFLNFTGSFGKMIVHGHTPVERPEIRNNRINIDTGGYISNRLSCLVLEEETQRFLWT